MSTGRRAQRILRNLSSTPGPDAIATLLCRLCTAAAQVSGTAVTLHSSSGTDRVLLGSDGIAGVAEDLQLLFGEGPTIEARHRANPVMCPDLDAVTGRWPIFGSAAVVAGVRAAFAVPLLGHGVHLGVLALYRDAPGELTDAQLTGTLAHTEAAAIALLCLQRNLRDDDRHPRLTPFDDPMIIHLAAGMIAVQAGVTPDDALQLLRARAFVTCTPMRALAAAVVDRRVTITLGDSDPTGH